MSSTIALGVLFVIFHQGLSSNIENIIIRKETIKNITVDWNLTPNGAISTILNNSRQNPSNDEQELRALGKNSNDANLMSLFSIIPGMNLTITGNKITKYPVKQNLRFLGKCDRGYKYCRMACRDAYRETCKDFECEKNFRVQIKKQCDVSCDKALEDADDK